MEINSESVCGKFLNSKDRNFGDMDKFKSYFKHTLKMCCDYQV